MLHAIPGVHDRAVFGIPDAEFGEAQIGIHDPKPHASRDAGYSRYRCEMTIKGS